jgi:hypothetical protein
MQQPFQVVLGSRLSSVTYYVLACDTPGFDLDDPNASGGCQGVRLGFDTGEIELSWDFRDPGSRDESTTYYLAVRSRPELETSAAEDPATDAAALVSLDATLTRCWRALVGESLRSVTVWGFPLSNGSLTPQAATLTFASGEVVVAIGMSGPEGCTVGDGDEVLVFDRTERRSALTGLKRIEA